MNDQVLLAIFLFVCIIVFGNVFGNVLDVLNLNRFEFFSDPKGNDLVIKNQKLLINYLTLVLRKRDAEKELYRLAQGHARVYHSPRLDLLDKQIYSLKKEIQKDPETLNFFKLHLDLTI